MENPQATRLVETVRQEVMRVPAEWAKHQSIWTAWPSHPELWLEDLSPARAEVAAMVKALAKGEKVKLLVMGEEAVASATAAFKGANVDIIPALFGDIWLRDTAPIFANGPDGLQALTFKFNGWGGKYELPHDDEVAVFVAAQAKAHVIAHDFVLEGGSLDFDGNRTVLTTKECLLNANRNPTLSREDIEYHLREAFGVKQIIWLEQGLVNDHTDGHIDNIARFVAPNRVVCASPSGDNDPNAATFEAIARDLQQAGLEVIRIPSPGLVADEDGEPMAASHMNFIIGNEVVIMPSYENVYSKLAVKALAPLFPGREVVALPAMHILSGGGSFHCITQQEPAA
jgi:agmatine deiminase